MDELEQVVLIFAFKEESSLETAAAALADRDVTLALPGHDEVGRTLAERLDLATGVDEKKLAAGQAEQIAWHREQGDTHLLAVTVMAEQGRALRREMAKLGGEDIMAPRASVQANDVSFDPGMEADDPATPPGEDRIFGPN